MQQGEHKREGLSAPGSANACEERWDAVPYAFAEPPLGDGRFRSTDREETGRVGEPPFAWVYAEAGNIHPLLAAAPDLSESPLCRRVLCIAGTNLFPILPTLRWVWAVVFAAAFLAVRAKEIYRDVQIIASTADDKDNKATVLLYTAWILFEIATLVHWVGSIILRNLVDFTEALNVDARYTGRPLWFAIFVQDTIMLFPLLIPSLAVQHVQRMDYVLYLVENCQILLVHWSTAMLLDHECQVLQAHLECASANGTAEAHASVYGKLQLVYGRWRVFLYIHIFLELLALMFLILAEYLSFHQELLVTGMDAVGSSLLMLICLLSCLRPVVQYNAAVERAQLYAKDFHTWQRFLQKPLSFQLVFGFTIEPKRFAAIVSSCMVAVLASIVRNYVHTKFGI